MPTRSKLRTAVEFTAARFLFSAMGLLPRRFAVGAGRALGSLTYLVVPKFRRIGDLNLTMAYPDMSASDRSRLLRDSMSNLGRNVADFTRFSSITPETLLQSTDVEGLENIEAARSRKRGVIMISAHFGGWEMISFTMSALGYPFDFLVRRNENPAVERLIETIRTRFGNRTIDKRSAARVMLTTLRAGNLLGLLVDINVVRNKGIFVDFFGVPACTTFIAAKLSLRTGAPLVPIFAPWDDQRQRYVVQIGAPLIIDRSGDEEKDVRQLTEKFTKVIEERIRRYPDQWLWIHKRWRTRPKGEKNFYEKID